PLAVSATLFADGTAPIVAWVGHGPRGGGRPCAELPLRALGQDRFAGWITPAATGWWEFSVWGAVDDFGVWLRDTRIRLEAGQDVGLDLADGADLARKRAGRADIADRDRERLLELATMLQGARSQRARLRAAGSDAIAGLMRRTADRSCATSSGPHGLWVDRPL